jgi:hypothetical protein
LAKNEYLMRHDRVCTHLQYAKPETLKWQTNGRHTHTQISVWTRRCYIVMESRDTHRKKSYTK